MTNESPPVVLTIAGSDCCAGAGLQADLKTFSTVGVHGLTVPTAIVAETPTEVADVHELPVAVIQEQLSLLLKTYPVAVVKTGILSSRAQIVAVADLLKNANLPLVVDPVIVASSGRSLTSGETLEALRERLVPLATLVTPNLAEARQLLQRQEETPSDLVEELAHTLGCSILLTGGHLPDEESAVDFLWHEGHLQEFRAPRLDIPSSHGTGCTLSAAIAARLAFGDLLPDAVRYAKVFISRSLKNAFWWDRTPDPPLIALDQISRGPGGE